MTQDVGGLHGNSRRTVFFRQLVNDLRFGVAAEKPLIFKAVGLFPDVFDSAGENALSFRDAVVRVIAVVEFRKK
jgi:hypothetical protein